jgi:hypothetical protein
MRPDKSIFVIIFICLCIALHGQNYIQTIRGTITNKDSKTPIIGVNVIWWATLHGKCHQSVGAMSMWRVSEHFTIKLHQNLMQD